MCPAQEDKEARTRQSTVFDLRQSSSQAAAGAGLPKARALERPSKVELEAAIHSIMSTVPLYEDCVRPPPPPPVSPSPTSAASCLPLGAAAPTHSARAAALAIITRPSPPCLARQVRLYELMLAHWHAGARGEGEGGGGGGGEDEGGPSFSPPFLLY